MGGLQDVRTMAAGQNEWPDQETEALLRAILRLRTADEAAKFFRDLMTEHELLEMRNRWLAVRLLDQGVPYKTIEARTHMSSRTLARIAHWMTDGKGGYRMMLDRLARSRAPREQQELEKRAGESPPADKQEQ
jgi:TrpR-related protein YerC/YecD